MDARSEPNRPRLPGDPFFRDQVQRKRERVVVWPPFWEDLPGLLAYPVRGGGWVKIVTGALFFALVFFMLRGLLAFGIGGLILGVILSTGFLGYLVNFLLSVTRKTTSHPEDNDPPGWPDFRSFPEQSLNFAKVFTIMLVPIILPAVAYAAASWSVSWSPNPLVLGLILIPGFFYVPMSILVFSVSENVIDALNPVMVLGSILRCGGPYFAAVPFMLFILGFIMLSLFVSALIPFSSIFFYLLFFYLSMVAFRLLGVLFLQCQVRLGWFDEHRHAEH